MPKKLIRRGWLAAILLLSALLPLSSCSSEETVRSGCLLLDGKNVAVPWVMKINGEEIGAEEYRYAFMSMKAEQDDGDESFWNQENAPVLKEMVAEHLTQMAAVEGMAEQYGIDRGDASAEYAAAQLAEVKASFESGELFQAALAQSYMTEELFVSILETDYIQSRLNEAMFGESGEYTLTDGELLEMIEREYVRVRYLAVKFDGENAAEKRTYAEELLQKIRNGSDFVEMVNTYGEDDGMNGNPDGLYLLRGMTTDAVFEDACFALAVDEISGIVASENTYYIIKRLPIEAEYVSENAEEFRNTYYGQIFADKLVALAKSYEVVYSEQYDKITAQSMG